MDRKFVESSGAIFSAIYATEKHGRVVSTLVDIFVTVNVGGGGLEQPVFFIPALCITEWTGNHTMSQLLAYGR